jgi:hypothetical protein
MKTVPERGELVGGEIPSSIIREGGRHRLRDLSSSSRLGGGAYVL